MWYDHFLVLVWGNCLLWPAKVRFSLLHLNLFSDYLRDFWRGGFVFPYDEMDTGAIVQGFGFKGVIQIAIIKVSTSLVKSKCIHRWFDAIRPLFAHLDQRFHFWSKQLVLVVLNWYTLKESNRSPKLTNCYSLVRDQNVIGCWKF